MLIFALVLFLLAASLGLVLARAVLARHPTSKPTVIAHGLAGATGLILLLLHALQQPQRLLTIAIALLVLAALGGAVLAFNDFRGKAGPSGLVIVHALAAVTAVTLVALVAF